MLLIRSNATLTFVAIGFLLIFGLILQRAFRSIRPIFRDRGKINAEVTGRLTETLGGVRIVKGFHAEDREAAVFEAGAMRLFENVRKTLLATSTIGLTSTLLMGIVSATVMILGGRLWIQSDDIENSSTTLMLGLRLLSSDRQHRNANPEAFAALIACTKC